MTMPPKWKQGHAIGADALNRTARAENPGSTIGRPRGHTPRDWFWACVLPGPPPAQMLAAMQNPRTIPDEVPATDFADARYWIQEIVFMGHASPFQFIAPGDNTRGILAWLPRWQQGRIGVGFNLAEMTLPVDDLAGLLGLQNSYQHRIVQPRQYYVSSTGTMITEYYSNRSPHDPNAIVTDENGRATFSAGQIVRCWRGHDSRSVIASLPGASSGSRGVTELPSANGDLFLFSLAWYVPRVIDVTPIVSVDFGAQTTESERVVATLGVLNEASESFPPLSVAPDDVPQPPDRPAGTVYANTLTDLVTP